MSTKSLAGSKPLKKQKLVRSKPVLSVVPSKPESETLKSPLTPSPGESARPSLEAGAPQSPKPVPFDQIAGQIQADAQKPGGKRGRPSNAELEARRKAAEAALKPPPDFSIYGKTARPYIPMVGELLVDQTGYDGWRISDPEADALSANIPPAMQELWPHMQSRYAACWTLAASVAMMGGARWIGYVRWKKTQGLAPVQSQGNSESTRVQPYPAPTEGRIYHAS